MESKIWTQCKIEKHIINFCKKYSDWKECNIKRGVKRYYGNKDRISKQQKIFYEKNRDKLLQKQNDFSKKKEAQNIKNYKDPMLIYKIN